VRVSGTCAREEGLRTLTSPRREASLFKLGRNLQFRPFSLTNFGRLRSWAAEACSSAGCGRAARQTSSFQRDAPSAHNNVAPKAYNKAAENAAMAPHFVHLTQPSRRRPRVSTARLTNSNTAMPASVRTRRSPDGQPMVGNGTILSFLEISARCGTARRAVSAGPQQPWRAVRRDSVDRPIISDSRRPHPTVQLDHRPGIRVRGGLRIDFRPLPGSRLRLLADDVVGDVGDRAQIQYSRRPQALVRLVMAAGSGVGRYRDCDPYREQRGSKGD
jgi:hypothetical protein